MFRAGPVQCTMYIHECRWGYIDFKAIYRNLQTLFTSLFIGYFSEEMAWEKGLTKEFIIKGQVARLIWVESDIVRVGKDNNITATYCSIVNLALGIFNRKSHLC
jgi:hypothetical protein